MSLSSAVQQPVPGFSLLLTHRAPGNPQGWDRHNDCFVADLDQAVSLRDYLVAFYDSWPFRTERALIAAAIGKRSTAADVQALAAGSVQTFSAWVVLERSDDQILLGDFQGNTRSWLAVRPRPDGVGTRLHFGSGVRSRPDPETGAPKLSWGFRALGGFHLLYSKILLNAARRRLVTQG